ncbi:Hypothetical_protein [Hexamita inflata]|uniref:Hypothetical_protein n=1 Tax=Hexamita inflata TaxID=28002 RepID=A0AA86NTD0_9EUKA|nr:Hypothetical protein HINF_LOCUS12653 [Hexamita inflata]CAI9965216.1 Hypothetical protein HINF_LOCUS52861 [Hexamita inflata]
MEWGVCWPRTTWTKSLASFCVQLAELLLFLVVVGGAHHADDDDGHDDGDAVDVAAFFSLFLHGRPMMMDTQAETSRMMSVGSLNVPGRSSRRAQAASAELVDAELWRFSSTCFWPSPFAVVEPSFTANSCGSVACLSLTIWLYSFV